MVKTSNLNNYSDVHYTDRVLAAKIIAHFKPTLPCLDPCRGDGAFFDHLPEGTDWCEIVEGKDFFDYDKRVEWVVTNPPFSDLTKWLAKAFEVSDNVVFLIPLSKLFSSPPRMEQVKKYGGIKTILYLGAGRKIGFDLGFPFGAVHFQKDYKGPTTIDWSD